MSLLDIFLFFFCKFHIVKSVQIIANKYCRLVNTSRIKVAKLGHTKLVCVPTKSKWLFFYLSLAMLNRGLFIWACYLILQSLKHLQVGWRHVVNMLASFRLETQSRCHYWICVTFKASIPYVVHPIIVGGTRVTHILSTNHVRT